MLDDLPKQYTEEDCVDWLREESCIHSGNAGEYAAISNIMSKETGIDFQYESSDESNEMAIMLPAYMPWSYNDKEKNCISAELDEIFANYHILAEDPV